MDHMTNNDNWLRDHTPRAVYRGPAGRHNVGVKILAGTCLITPSKKPYGNKAVYFGDFFSSRCQPVVTTGTVSAHQRRIHVTLNGFGRLHPDRRGFRVFINIDAKNKKNNKIARRFHVHWQALGY